MALDSIDAVCTKCGTKFTQVPKQSFLGFRTLICPTCQEKLTYPLTKSRSIVYWVIFGWMAFIIFNDVNEGLGNNLPFLLGRISIPLVLGIAAISAILKDRSIRKYLSKTTNSAASNVVG